MKDLMARLTVIYYYAKDIHYSAIGMTFYSTHLLMDRITDGIQGYIDQINEVCFLGRGEEAPTSQSILTEALKKFPEHWTEKGSLEELRDFIGGTLENILETEQNNNGKYLNAEISLLDDIAKDLQLKAGLLNQTLRE